LALVELRLLEQTLPIDKRQPEAARAETVSERRREPEPVEAGSP
jgi:hypothetical protein